MLIVLQNRRSAEKTLLVGGLKLGRREWIKGEVSELRPVRVAVAPSGWRLVTQRQGDGKNSGKVPVILDPYGPPVNTQIKQIDQDNWKITLAWSKEVLEQAAYEMTYNYMSQVGECVFEEQPLPKTWRSMTTSEAGYNAIREALYYMLLLNMPKRQDRLAIKLHNIYCYGYAKGSRSREVLGPEDFGDED